METINPKSTAILLHVCALVFLFGFGIFYAYLVRLLRRRARDHGYTAVLVVFGVAVVVATYSVVAGLGEGARLLGLFAAAGLPMVWEYTDDHLTREEGRRRRYGVQDLMEELNGISSESRRVQLDPHHHRGPRRG